MFRVLFAWRVIITALTFKRIVILQPYEVEWYPKTDRAIPDEVWTANFHAWN